MKLIKISLLFVITTINAFAQNEPKTGYTNVEYIISKLPEVKKISDELEKQKKQYDNAYQQKVKEFQEKYNAYQKNGASLPEIIKVDKEKELQTMDASIKELQQNAEKDLTNKQAQLIQPLYVKVYSAIQAVAEENGYKFIFNTGDSNQMRHLLVAPTEGDVSELVLKKLGTTAKEEVKAKEAAIENKKEATPKADTKTTKAPVKKPAAKAPVKKKK
ncbi:MAG: OmpH family outer membrane protein [Bacteroidota bacterium]